MSRPAAAIPCRLAATLLLLGLASGVRPHSEGWLGVTVADGGTSATPAARLTTIVPDGPAADAGLTASDLVVAAGTRRIASARELVRLVRARSPGSALTLTLERAGETHAVTVTLAERPIDVWRRLEAERDAWQEPTHVLDVLHIRSGSRVADVGAGQGYFTELLAARVGHAGSVVAVDVEPDALRTLRQRFPSERYPQVTVRRGSAGNPGLAPASLDAALLVDTFHELVEPAALLRGLRLALAPGGCVAIIDRPAREISRDAHAVPEAYVLDTAKAAGFVLRERIDLPRQFLIVLGASED